MLESFTNAAIWSEFKQNQANLASSVLIPSTTTVGTDINKIGYGLTPDQNIEISIPTNNYANALLQLNQDNNKSMRQLLGQDVPDL